jgi:hypothetical protein
VRRIVREFRLSLVDASKSPYPVTGSGEAEKKTELGEEWRA